MNAKLKIIGAAVLCVFSAVLFLSGCAPTSTWGTLVTSGTSPVDLNGKAQIVGEVNLAENLNSVIGPSPYSLRPGVKGFKTQLRITQLGIKTESSEGGKFYFNDLNPGQYIIEYSGDRGEMHEAYVNVKPNQTLHLALYVQKGRRIFDARSPIYYPSTLHQVYKWSVRQH